MKKLNMESI